MNTINKPEKSEMCIQRLIATTRDATPLEIETAVTDALKSAQEEGWM